MLHRTLVMNTYAAIDWWVLAEVADCFTYIELNRNYFCVRCAAHSRVVTARFLFVVLAHFVRHVLKDIAARCLLVIGDLLLGNHLRSKRLCWQ